MKNYFLSTAVLISLGLSLSGVALVNARSAGTGAGQPIINRIPPVNEYFSTITTFVSAQVDPTTGQGTVVTSRQDSERGLIETTYITTARTSYLKKHGGTTTLSAFRAGEEISVYALRNRDGSLTALKVTNNNLWFLDPVIQEGEITKANLSNNQLTVKVLASGVSVNVSYSDQTYIQTAKNLPGQETDLLTGKKIKVRGVARKTGNVTAIEETMVIWILPEHGE